MRSSLLLNWNPSLPHYAALGFALVLELDVLGDEDEHVAFVCGLMGCAQACVLRFCALVLFGVLRPLCFSFFYLVSFRAVWNSMLHLLFRVFDCFRLLFNCYHQRTLLPCFSTCAVLGEFLRTRWRDWFVFLMNYLIDSGQCSAGHLIPFCFAKRAFISMIRFFSRSISETSAGSVVLSLVWSARYLSRKQSYNSGSCVRWCCLWFQIIVLISSTHVRMIQSV